MKTHFSLHPASTLTFVAILSPLFFSGCGDGHQPKSVGGDVLSKGIDFLSVDEAHDQLYIYLTAGVVLKNPHVTIGPLAKELTVDAAKSNAHLLVTNIDRTGADSVGPVNIIDSPNGYGPMKLYAWSGTILEQQRGDLGLLEEATFHVRFRCSTGLFPRVPFRVPASQDATVDWHASGSGGGATWVSNGNVPRPVYDPSGTPNDSSYSAALQLSHTSSQDANTPIQVNVIAGIFVKDGMYNNLNSPIYPPTNNFSLGASVPVPVTMDQDLTIPAGGYGDGSSNTYVHWPEMKCENVLN